MKAKIKYVLIPISLIALLLLYATPILAQGQGPLSATVDRTVATTDDMIVLTVAVNASVPNAPAPTLPNLAGFTVVGTSSSSQISIINGTMNSQINYSYRLQPYQAGELVIDPVQITLNGQTFSTDPITVQVTQGTGVPSAAPAPSSSRPSAPISSELAGQKAFVEAAVDNPTPYVGEQITYTFRYYRAIDMFDLFDQPQFEPPPFQGFWTENESDQAQYRAQAGSRFYDVTELRTRLFPSKTGPITIDPARLTVPGSFFSSGATLQTQPINLEVKPLPTNAPEGFNGAVGQFTINATVDTTTTRVNEPITWQVTLTARGNLDTMPDPDWPEIDSWRSFESQATINTQLQDGQVVGSRVYERLLVPQTEGEFAIPSLEYTFFDPETGQYQTVTTLPIPITITPGDNLAGQAQSYAPSPDTEQENLTQVAADIRHLKSVPARLSAGGGSIMGSPLYWLAWAIPLAALAGNFVWQRRSTYWQNNAGLARSSKARKKARQALIQARKQKQDAYSAAGQILTTYLADKLNQPVVGLTQQQLAELLVQRGISTELIERVNNTLSDAEMGHYSPDASSPDHAANMLKAVDLLTRDLEKAV
jgi:hypothetical protein